MHRNRNQRPLPRITRTLGGLVLVSAVLTGTVAGTTGAWADRTERSTAFTDRRTTGTSGPLLTAPGPNRTTLNYALIRSTTTPARGAILLLPGSDGMRDFYLTMAREYAASGVDVVVGCWFATPDPSQVSDYIACPGAPTFTGVSPATVPVVRAFVALTKRLTRMPSSRLGVVGYSRGGGAALLWAARTHVRVPITSVAGMVTGTVRFGAVTPEETGTSVVAEAAGIRAPVLILHALADGIVPVQQSIDLAGALTAAGRTVAEHWYGACGAVACNHDWIFNQPSRGDIIARSVQWTVAHTAS